MTTFIELTDAGSWNNHYRPLDDRIVVNPAHIASLYRRPATGEEFGFLPQDRDAAHTILTLANGQIYNVAETPEEIARLAALAAGVDTPRAVVRAARVHPLGQDRYSVLGSDGESFYRVSVLMGGNAWLCNCPAGENGTPCKHCGCVYIYRLGEAMARRDCAGSDAPATGDAFGLARCPDCGQTEVVRMDGTLAAHTRPMGRGTQDERRCLPDGDRGPARLPCPGLRHAAAAAPVPVPEALADAADPVSPLDPAGVPARAGNRQAALGGVSAGRLRSPDGAGGDRGEDGRLTARPEPAKVGVWGDEPARVTLYGRD